MVCSGSSTHFKIATVYSRLTESKLKCPLNLQEVHPRLHYFYGILKLKELGPWIDVEIIWFSAENQNCAIAVKPFGHAPNYYKAMMQF